MTEINVMGNPKWHIEHDDSGTMLAHTEIDGYTWWLSSDELPVEAVSLILTGAGYEFEIVELSEAVRVSGKLADDDALDEFGRVAEKHGWAVNVQ